MSALKALHWGQALLQRRMCSNGLRMFGLQLSMCAAQRGQLLLGSCLGVQMLLQGAVRRYGSLVVRLQLAQALFQRLHLLLQEPLASIQ